MLYPSLLAKLACPACHGKLVPSSENLQCDICERSFPLESGFPSLIPDREVASFTSTLQLSVLILAKNEGQNLHRALSQLLPVLEDLGASHEILVMDGHSTDNTVVVAQEFGARVATQEKPGYGNAFREGLRLCKGEFVFTFDADGSHDPGFLRVFWPQRETGELLIGSRYISRGEAWMPFYRLLLSRILNRVMSTTLSIPIKDLSSGFRLYRRSSVLALDLKGKNFDVLIEILVKMYLEGHRIRELPFLFKPREDGSSNVSLFRFAVSYAASGYRLWRERSSILACDYDDRAYHSRIFPQMYWQRRRFTIIKGMLAGRNTEILDVGCGSGKVIQSLPAAVAADILERKLRFLRLTNPLVVHASVFALPFHDEAFECVICSQVIEHIPNTEDAITELLRVLKPGGQLILGTPDFGSWQWPLIEKIYDRVIPGGYAEEHINPLTRDNTVAMVERLGARFQAEDFILRAEWVGSFVKLGNTDQ